MTSKCALGDSVHLCLLKDVDNRGQSYDISDSQYRRFRPGLGQLTALAFGYLLIARLVGRHSRNRIKFQTRAAALILLALHGTSVFKILIIITANYHPARRAPSPLIWVFNVGVLFANDYWDGYRYRHFLPFLSFLRQQRPNKLPVPTLLPHPIQHWHRSYSLWIVSVFVIPEVLAKKVFSGSIHEKKWYFRHLSAIGGTLNVLSMMSANLVGFVIGLDGVEVMWSQPLGPWSGTILVQTKASHPKKETNGKVVFLGFLTLLTTFGALFCAVQMMMENREEERREGIWRKCH
ncbi:uncharacterized protein MELLADRAFT_101925 [Melampsora larici-populina 98AG31]|uniref:Uncharacterized protein n=1 Tax=Melampsora larici-populina (strain 98AG31 / pathotype 3-4-7) TaxID=747676 RepID=F4R5D5_MELLP|nr:uncharacterized protein MELLADRAFT_101925 [Melampsora larici-populina 98AG31]EGG12027.1 hypothetical protein MELLADRAFT_101925 [Melampsora larici-populina 98AG31]